MVLVFIGLVGVLLAYANGANDNFKGVKTLFGSGTAGDGRALARATLTTALGSVTALVLARGLLTAFSGSGLVPATVVADPVFSAAVALAAGVTVMLATWLGFPISTTHALIGVQERPRIAVRKGSPRSCAFRAPTPLTARSASRDVG